MFFDYKNIENNCLGSASADKWITLIGLTMPRDIKVWLDIIMLNKPIYLNISLNFLKI
jgi:hypothetical protein